MAALVEFGFDASKVYSGVSKLEGRLSGFQKTTGAMSGGIGRLAGGLTTGLKSMLPAIGLTAFASGTKALLNSMDDLADMSLKFGETPEVLQRVGHAALLAGTDVETVGDSFLKLERALGDVENAKAAESLERLGLTGERLTRMPLTEKIVALSNAFQKGRAQGTGYNDGVNLLGKSFKELIPLLEQSEDQLRNTFSDITPISNAVVFATAANNDIVDGIINKETSRLKEFAAMALLAIGALTDPKGKKHLTGGDNSEVAKMNADAAAIVAKLEKAKEDAAAANAKRAADRDAEVARRAKEKVDNATAAAAKQKAALGDYLSEVLILRETISGHIKKAELMREQVEIEKEKRKLMADFNMAEADALALARQRIQLNKAPESGKGEKDGKIHGYRQEQGGAHAARKRGLTAADDARGRAEGKVKEKMGGGLDWLYNSRANTLDNTMAWRGSFPGLDEFGAMQKPSHPLAKKAAANASAADKGGGGNRIEDLLKEQTKVLQKGLLGE